jgi:hypothetical protein
MMKKINDLAKPLDYDELKYSKQIIFMIQVQIIEFDGLNG